MRGFREHVHTARNRSFSSTLSSLDTYEYGLHYHPQCELTVFQGGAGIRVMGDHVAQFRGGDMVLIPPNLPHYWSLSEAPAHAQERHLHVVKFAPVDLKGLLDLPEVSHIKRLVALNHGGYHITAPDPTRLTGPLLRLHDSAPASALGLLLEILDYVASQCTLQTLSQVGFGSAEAVPQRLKVVCDHIQKHFQRRLKLDELAQLAHLTPPAFSRYFSQTMGKPFSQYLNELRISHACNLLLDTEDTVLTVSLESGFESLTNFNRRFRELRGMTPREYRNRGQQGLPQPIS